MGRLAQVLAVCFLVLILHQVEIRAQNQVNKTVFTFRLQSEPETLDWNKAHTPLETHLLCNLMEGLLGIDSKLQLAPVLAERWKLSQDHKVYTFQIRPHVKWTDGSELKAQDFVYSWKRLLTSTTAAPYAYFLYDIVGAKDYNQGRLKDFKQVGIKALGPFSLQISLKEPVSYWPYITSFWVTFPMRQEVVEAPGFSWESVDQFVTLGPYLLDKHEFNSKYVLKTNPNYYASKGNLDEVHALIISDDSTALNLYESGHLDFLSDLSTIDLKRLESRSDLQVFPYLKTVYLGFALNHDSVADSRVRRALSRAIDKTQFGPILKGHQEAASSFLPLPLRGLFGIQAKGLNLDLPQAKEEFRLLPVKPKRLTLTLPSVDKSMLVGQILQSQFKKNFGIELELQAWDNKAYRSRLDQKANPLFLTSWSADYPDPDNFYSVFLSDSGNNRTSWKDPRYDENLGIARHSRQAATRKKIYEETEGLLLQEAAAIVPLYYEPNLALVGKKVKNLELNHFNYLRLKDVIIDSKIHLRN